MTLCVALCLPVAAWAQDRPTTPSPNIESVPAALAPTYSQAPTASTAAGVQRLSLRQAIELAFTHNPDLAAAALEVNANEGVRQQAGAYPNPEISYLQEDTQRATRTATLQLNQP
ncbi:cobalt-zinc-cadmium resistance protein, partial [Aromatoleum evansii]|nr:cobalt-zinc-cadmium resistance protein [Aromatoleum evansii]